MNKPVTYSGRPDLVAEMEKILKRVSKPKAYDRVMARLSVRQD